MSENQESEETLLPDDADRKIEELMAALKESEREMMGDDAPIEEAEEPVDEFDSEEDFLDEGEGDFVDLDAEQLDNTADKLELDESDEVEDALLEQLTASVTPSEEELAAQAAREAQQRQDNEQQEMEANELARARLDELEEKLAAVEAKPLQAPAYGKRSGGFPSWLSAAFSLLAIALGGAALWLNLNAPPPQLTPVAQGVKQELQGLKVDLAALRERLSAVEKQTEAGSDEALATLDRMQAMLARMERKIIVGTTVAEASAVAPKTEPIPVAIQPEPQPPVVEAESVSPVAPQTAEAQPPAGKVFIKGWAVNLRSFYHRKDAEQLMQRFQSEGIDAEVREIPKGEATWHRVRVMGFDSKQAANAFIDGLTEAQGRDMAWPSHYAGYVER